jgi:predicted metal-dependent phosphoesterase TrpH
MSRFLERFVGFSNRSYAFAETFSFTFGVTHMPLFDLHLATAMSGNALIAPEDLIEQALELGLAGIGVVERNDYAASAVCAEFAEGTPLTVLRGVEIETDLGALLVYGCSDADADALCRFGDWSAGDAAEFVHARGGICIPAHPFDDVRRSLGERLATLPGVFVIEGLNGRADAEANRLATDFADREGFAVIGGSDAFTLAGVGQCATEFFDPIRTEADFLAALRARRFGAQYFAAAPSLIASGGSFR